MQGISGARRHWPALVIELERDMSREPKTIQSEMTRAIRDNLNKKNSHLPTYRLPEDRGFRLNNQTFRRPVENYNVGKGEEQENPETVIRGSSKA